MSMTAMLDTVASKVSGPNSSNAFVSVTSITRKSIREAVSPAVSPADPSAVLPATWPAVLPASSPADSPVDSPEVSFPDAPSEVSPADSFPDAPSAGPCESPCESPSESLSECARALSIIPELPSIAVTRAPSPARNREKFPFPHAMSSTLSPGSTASSRSMAGRTSRLWKSLLCSPM